MTTKYKKDYRAWGDVLDYPMPEYSHMTGFEKTINSGYDHNLVSLTLTFNPLKRLRSIVSPPPINSTDDPIIHGDVLKYIGLWARKNKVRIILFPEYTKSYDIHYHGVIEATPPIVARFKKYWTKNYGLTYIKDIENIYWLNYLVKDYGKTELSTVILDGRIKKTLVK